MAALALVSNAGTAAGLVRIVAVLRDADNLPIEARVYLDADSLVPAGAFRRIPLRVVWRPRTWPVSATLLLADGNSAVLSPRPWILAVSVVPRGYSGVVTIWTLIASVLVTVLCGVKLGRRLSERWGAAAATWDFEKSWATNVNAAGAVINNFVVVIAALPQPLYLSKAEYSLTSVLFASLVVLAPTVYNLLMVRGSETGPVRQGFVITFLLACGLTLWGVFGQLAILAVMIRDFTAARALAPAAERVFWGVLACAAVAVVVYAVSTARGMAPPELSGAPAPAVPGPHGARMAAVGASAAPRWAIL